MEFKIESHREKYRRLTEWHRFVALWPRKVADGHFVFLAVIERRAVYRKNLDESRLFGAIARWEYRVAATSTEEVPREHEEEKALLLQGRTRTAKSNRLLQRLGNKKVSSTDRNSFF